MSNARTFLLFSVVLLTLLFAYRDEVGQEVRALGNILRGESVDKHLPPKLEVTINGADEVRVVSTDDYPFVIERVLMNNRHEVAACDVREAKFAHSASVIEISNPMKTGSAGEFLFPVDCGIPVKLDIFTDRGEVSFSITRKR